MTTDYKYLFKILIIGDSGVGKSSILLKYVDDLFIDSYISTIGVDFKIKTVPIDGQPVKLQIWDTAGQERFRTITSSFYRGSNGIIMVYDVSNQESFDNIMKWLNEINKYATDDVVKLLVGNKCDLESQREVSYKTGKALANELNVPFIETSAKDYKFVNQAFTIMINEIKKKVDKGIMTNVKSSSQLSSTKIEKNDCEC